MIRTLSKFLIGDLLRSSWRSVVLLWKPMALWTILVYVIFSAVSAPVLLSLLDWTIFQNSRIIAGNEDILTFIFSPSGLMYLFILSLISITGIVIRFAGLFDIVSNYLLGNNVSVRQTTLHIATRIHKILKITAVSLLFLFLFLIPLTAGLAAIQNAYLSEFTISNYLETTPPEWYRALTIGGIWFGVWLMSFLLTLACVLPSLPAYLESNLSIRESLLKVWHMPMRRTLVFLKSVTLVLLTWFVIRLLFDASLFWLFITSAGWLYAETEALRTLSFLAGGYFFTGFIGSIVISFFGFSFISSLLTKFYYSYTKPSILPQSPGLLNLTQKTLQIVAWWTKPIRAILLVIIFITGSIIASHLIISSSDESQSTLIIAHRANSYDAPENSLPALQNAIALGVDFVEIDVQLTSDGVPVLFHDEDLQRMTGIEGKISELTFDELQHLSLIHHASESKTGIPSLQSVLQHAKDKVSVMIELKYFGFHPELAPIVVQMIRDFNMEEDVLIKSLNLSGVRQLHDIAPDIGIGYVSAAAFGDLSRLPVHFLSVNHSNITPQLVTTFQNRGLAVFGWTANTRDDIINLILLNVNGVITDHPGLAIPLAQEINSLNNTEKALLSLGLTIIETQPLQVFD